MDERLVHPLADIQSKSIGARTRIWQFVVVLPNARIGEDCNICSHCFIENDVEIGNRVTVKNGVHLWDGLRVMDDVFIGPNVNFTNDRFPRSKQHPPVHPQTILGAGASVGAGATVLPGLTIGAKAMIGAGAVVTRSVPPHAIVVGNPARIVGYEQAEAPSAPQGEIFSPGPRVGATPTRVRGVTMHRLPLITDIRGSVTVGEFEKSVPFPVRRYFLVLDVPSLETRGAHAHLRCHQFLVCVRGSCSVVADDGLARQEFLLNRPEIGVYLPPLVWGIQYRYSADAVLLVFASDYYDAADYIRDYDRFLQIVGGTA